MAALVVGNIASGLVRLNENWPRVTQCTGSEYDEVQPGDRWTCGVDVLMVLMDSWITERAVLG